MKIRRLTVAAVAVAAVAVIVSGCSAPSTSSEIAQNTSITLASNGSVTSFNENTPQTYSTYNANLTNLTTTGWNYYDNTPKLQQNTAFGTYKVTSTSPLTVQYTINKGATWSDGDQVNAADVLLTWASDIAKYNSAKGVNFNSIGVTPGVGIDSITSVPTISSDGLTITTTYSKPFVDWEQSLLSPYIPAHIAYQEAFPAKNLSNADADAAVIKAIQTDDTATIKALAAAWSTKWNVTSMPTDPKLLVVDGPYVVSDFVKDKYITLQLRKGYTAGPGTPTVSTVTLRFIPDNTAAIQALSNGEVNIVTGQPTTDTLAAVQKITGVKYTTDNSATYEHVDLTFNRPGGPFNPATYGGDATKALEVREAFLKAVPRQEILDKLIKPLNPNAVLDDSQMFLPGAAGYDQSVAASDAKSYDAVDIAGAKALLAKAGVTSPTVIFAYPTDNPRRVNEFKLIQQSAQQAGFVIKDDGAPTATYFGNLGNSKYDVALFAWQYTSLAYTGNQAAFQTAGTANYNGYSNKASDTLWDQLATSTGTADQNNALLAQIDKNAWADAYGVTLYQFPNLVAWTDNVSNVSDNPVGVGPFWNYWQWQVTPSSTSPAPSATN
ncbi:ABC transporter substrate-binding protein [Gryllotalpicola sp.]|uniref:ABC transporter substrate-binding protein n=1 Tax=Gryllotalpicola sp. TaxID=1932787 RepID=UPI002602AC6D|nr:ABC transporter substrate-binding protein [Gryllotalpicola sp.]